MTYLYQTPAFPEIHLKTNQQHEHKHWDNHLPSVKPNQDNVLRNKTLRCTSEGQGDPNNCWKPSRRMTKDGEMLEPAVWEKDVQDSHMEGVQKKCHRPKHKHILFCSLLSQGTGYFLERQFTVSIFINLKHTVVAETGGNLYHHWVYLTMEQSGRRSAAPQCPRPPVLDVFVRLLWLPVFLMTQGAEFLLCPPCWTQWQEGAVSSHPRQQKKQHTRSLNRWPAKNM